MGRFFETRKPACERNSVELREYALEMMRLHLDKGVVYAMHSDHDLERASRYAMIAEALRPDPPTTHIDALKSAA